MTITSETTYSWKCTNCKFYHGFKYRNESDAQKGLDDHQKNQCADRVVCGTQVTTKDGITGFVRERKYVDSSRYPDRGWYLAVILEDVDGKFIEEFAYDYDLVL